MALLSTALMIGCPCGTRTVPSRRRQKQASFRADLLHLPRQVANVPFQALAGTALFCRQAPPRGGATCFADAVAAWEALPPEQQQRLEMLGAGNLTQPVIFLHGIQLSNVFKCANFETLQLFQT